MQASRPNGEGRRKSLYLRALLFVVTGCGALLGAILILSRLLLADAEARLLDERVSLARTIGVVLEERIRSDMAALSRVAARVLAEPAPSARARMLDDPSIAEAFAAGALVLDAQLRVVAARGESLGPADWSRVVKQAKARNRLVVGRSKRIGDSAVVLGAIPVRDRAGGGLGAAVGRLDVSTRGALRRLAHDAENQTASLGLIDSAGIPFASSVPLNPLNEGDHDGALARAIARHSELKGRCHTCHEEREGHKQRQNQVMAFAPLPSLPLGLRVMQPESQALSPAFVLRGQLWLIGGSLLFLFVVFATLSVHSVVRPISALTRAVRRMEHEGVTLCAESYGRDEIGELAAALELLHRRTRASLAAAESHRRALSEESEAIRRHLSALQAISDYSIAQPHMQALLEHALGRALELCQSTSGMLYIKQREHTVMAVHGLSAARANELCAQLSGSLPDGAVSGEPMPALAGEPAEANGTGAEGAEAREQPLAFVERTLGLELGLAALNTQLTTRAPPFVRSLLRHISMSVSHVLLKDAIEERRSQQALYLGQVLQSQETERQRIARELHDTVAQDLAALRLEIERVLRRISDDPLRDRLADFEARTRQMLDTVRAILLDLRLSILDSMGIVAALRWLVERVEREHGCRARFVLDGPDEPALDYHTSMTLFRILQEALLNVSQHARAEHVFVTLVARDEFVELVVEDDGVGFDAENRTRPRSPEDKSGFGLLGMEERAGLVGGSFQVVSSYDEGTTLRARLPIAPADGEAPLEHRSGAG